MSEDTPGGTCPECGGRIALATGYVESATVDEEPFGPGEIAPDSLAEVVTASVVQQIGLHGKPLYSFVLVNRRGGEMQLGLTVTRDTLCDQWSYELGVILSAWLREEGSSKDPNHLSDADTAALDSLGPDVMKRLLERDQE